MGEKTNRTSFITRKLQRTTQQETKNVNTRNLIS